MTTSVAQPPCIYNRFRARVLIRCYFHVVACSEWRKVPLSLLVYAIFNYAAMVIVAVQKILTKWARNTEVCSTNSIGSRELAYMFNAVYDGIDQTNSNRQSDIEEVQQDIAVRYAKLTSELTLMMNKIQGSVQVDQKEFIKKTMDSITANRLKVHREVMDACATVTALDAKCQHLEDQVADLQATFNRLFGEDKPNWKVDDLYKSLHSFQDAAREFRQLWKAMSQLSKNYDSCAKTMECITKEPGGKDGGESIFQRPDKSPIDIATRIQNARQRARRAKQNPHGTVYYDVDGSGYSDSEFSS